MIICIIPAFHTIYYTVSIFHMKRKTEKHAPPIVSWTHIASLQTDLILIESDDSQQLEDSLFQTLITPALSCQEEEAETPSDQMQEGLIQREPIQQLVEASQELSSDVSDGYQLKQMFTSERNAGRRGCNCRSSHCSKNYCECLRMGLTCVEGLCSCCHCQNHEETATHRTNSQRMALEENGLRGCKCKKSQCLKRYCECHSGGRKCGLACQCISCYNREQNQTNFDHLRKLRKGEIHHNSKHHSFC